MPLQKNIQKSILQFTVWLIVCILIIALIEANYKMLLAISPNPSKLLTTIKAMGFGLAAIVVIIYHKKLGVKLLFVAVDIGVMLLFQYFDTSTWKHSGAIIYALYTGLILGFIGTMASTMYHANDPLAEQLAAFKAGAAEKEELISKFRAKDEIAAKIKLISNNGPRSLTADQKMEKRELEQQLINLEQALNV